MSVKITRTIKFSCRIAHNRFFVLSTVICNLSFASLPLKKVVGILEQYDFPDIKKTEELSVYTIQGRSCRIQKDGKIAIGLTKKIPREI